MLPKLIQDRPGDSMVLLLIFILVVGGTFAAIFASLRWLFQPRKDDFPVLVGVLLLAIVAIIFGKP